MRTNAAAAAGSSSHGSSSTVGLDVVHDEERLPEHLPVGSSHGVRDGKAGGPQRLHETELGVARRAVERRPVRCATMNRPGGRVDIEHRPRVAEVSRLRSAYFDRRTDLRG